MVLFYLLDHLLRPFDLSSLPCIQHQSLICPTQTQWSPSPYSPPEISCFTFTRMCFPPPFLAFLAQMKHSLPQWAEWYPSKMLVLNPWNLWLLPCLIKKKKKICKWGLKGRFGDERISLIYSCGLFNAMTSMLIRERQRENRYIEKRKWPHEPRGANWSDTLTVKQTNK